MSSLFSALLNGAVLGVLLTAAVWAALSLAPKRLLNAATRYWVWCAAMVLVLAMPLLYWHPAKAARPAQTAAIVIYPAPANAAVQALTPMPAAASPQRLPVLPLTIPEGPWMGWLAALWGTSALALLVRLLIGYVLLARRSARAVPIPGGAAAWLNRCGSRRRDVRAAYTGEVAVPLASGPYRPAILIPENLLKCFSEAELEQIGLHEAAHLARYDDWLLLFERIAEAVFALHPAVRWIARRMDLEREIACDDFVLATAADPHPYATCLTRVAGMAVRSRALAGAAAAERSNLTRRVNMLLDRSRNKATGVMKAQIAATIVVLAALTWIAARSPRWVALAAPAPVRIATVLIPPSAPSLAAPALRLQPRLLAQVQGAPPPLPLATPSVASVEVVVTVMDSEGHAVSDLTQGDFRLFDNDVAQSVGSFERRQAGSVGIILNIQDAAAIPAWQEALTRASSGLNPALSLSLNGVDQDGLLATTTQAAERLKQAPGPRRVLLVISESATRPSEYSMFLRDRALVQAAGSANEMVRPVDVIVDTPAQLESTSLSQFVGSSGYLLRYSPSGVGGGSAYHSLKVMVDRPGLNVQSRQGYFPQQN